MAKRLDIRLYGDPILRKTAKPVEAVDDEIRDLVEDMLVTMYEAEGIGLAAPQIGRSIRLLVFDTGDRGRDGRGPTALINPEILESSGEWTFDEGCLSLPGISAEITRPMTVRVRYLAPDGEQKIEVMDELAGRVVQHEMDHLDGKLFVDHLSPMKRSLILKKLRKLERGERSEAPAL